MRAFNRVLQKIARIIFRIFYVFTTIAFAFLLTILLVNVASRNLFSGAIAWIEESSRFVFTWMMFLGISIGVYYKKHLGVEFIVSHYPKKIRRAVEYFGTIMLLLLFLVLLIYGIKYCKTTMRMYSPILDVPYGLVYMCIPVGSALSVFYCIADLSNKTFGEEEKEAK